MLQLILAFSLLEKYNWSVYNKIELKENFASINVWHFGYGKTKDPQCSQTTIELSCWYTKPYLMSPNIQSHNYEQTILK